jgi:N-methylhydantoinase A
VPRDHVAEIVERIMKDGSVLVALDEEQARISLLALLEQDIGAVAVALLRFFKDPAHDRRDRELIRSNDLGQSLSVERMCPRSSVQSKPDL